MASTSASSNQKRFKYDVFLSFRGEDTRKNFVNHLYHALNQKGIITYKDDEKIQKGERISEQLITSIEESRFYIIVFSKNYASSSWCLDELVKIMECQKTIEHIAYPVFYDVEPTEVRHQSGAVGKAFANHVEKEGVGIWRDALKEAADLAGWELKNTFDGHEAQLIQKIAKAVSLKLHIISLRFDEKLVGMEARVKIVVSSLELNSHDARMIGIKGMGGGGKTTLARAVFDRISIWFEGVSFVENVREVSKSSSSGLKKLQKQVLKDVLNAKDINVTSVFDGINMMKRVMGTRKVLVVLDDVDHIDQLKALAGEPTWFKPESKIIITTRDKQVLVAHGVHSDNIHDVNLLSNEEAICLFSRCAFKREVPVQEYEELSRRVVHYAAGLPLTITVLGSFLCGRVIREWEDALERLKTIPEDQTLKRLELSFNGLENDHKEIFLDLACILKGMKAKKAIRILESFGFHAKLGIRVLEQKSLLTISNDDRFLLHDHLEEMGMHIVRRLHPDEPNKHIRLWIAKEVEDILVNDLGTEAIRSIKLKYTELHSAIIMKGLKKMTKLRFLYVDYGDKRWEFDEVGPYLPNTLQSLHWYGYPFRYLPKTFQGNKLVDLEIRSSNISQLYEGGDRKVLSNLKFLELSHSKLKTFDLGMTPILETFLLKECMDFVELHMPVKCSKLKSIRLTCTKLSNLNLGMAPNLEKLRLVKCDELVELHMPVECPKLKLVDLCCSKLSNLKFGMAPNLEELRLVACNELVELHMNFECPKLKYLDASYSMLSNLNLRMTPNLEELRLVECNEFAELHMHVECSKLKFLDLTCTKLGNLNLGMTPYLETLNCYELLELHMPIECPKLKFVNLISPKLSNLNLGMTPNLEELCLGACNYFEELYMPVECPKLKILTLSDSKVRNLNLGMTPNLVELYLGACKYFEELYMPIECPKLKFLHLGGSKVKNLNLGMTPNLEIMDLEGCYCLQEIHAPVGCLKKLVYLNLSGCRRFKNFLVDKRHDIICVESVAILELTAETFEICPLHPNNNLPKFQFNCNYVEPLPSSSGNLEKLLSFGLCTCTNLESFSTTICGLRHLGALTLEGSIPEVPKDLYQLESLKKLCMSMTKIKHLPDSICMLKHLKYLDLKSCWLLEQLPNDLGRLVCLEELYLTDCISLQDIPNSICKMKCLQYLYLSYCVLIEKLPEELGCLERLKVLNTEGAGVIRLPRSLFRLKGLCIVGSSWRLLSYGFTSLKEISTYTASCYIRDRDSEPESP